MFEIICVGSLALSINVCQGEKFSPITVAKKNEILNVIKQEPSLNKGYSAQIIANESEYRREADREGERHEINAPDENREDRIYRDAEEHRRENESEDRIYRDGSQRPREEHSDDRIYRDASEHRRDEHSESERDRYEERDRSRKDYETEDSKSLQDLFEDWFSE